mmetsp:Transcript_30648/g.46293  ORF Transcript_30648/g.46293 Transcript_30648/m.46293 type:complete len:97 (+) Transcript_30648:271-561(+)
MKWGGANAQVRKYGCKHLLDACAEQKQTCTQAREQERSAVREWNNTLFAPASHVDEAQSESKTAQVYCVDEMQEQMPCRSSSFCKRAATDSSSSSS